MIRGAPLKRQLLELEILLRRKQGFWETPRNLAIVLGTAVALAGLVFGTIGYKLGSAPLSTASSNGPASTMSSRFTARSITCSAFGPVLTTSGRPTTSRWRSTRTRCAPSRHCPAATAAAVLPDRTS